MYRACVRLLTGLLVASSVYALGHSKRLRAIDEYCAAVQRDVSSSSPFVFSGPDPWVQMDEEPGTMPNDALALVYTSGPEIRWVFLRIVDADAGRTEDVNYFFRPDGAIVKRIRQVQSPGANVSFEVVTYYQDGRILKENTHHHWLQRGHEDVSAFNDPDAPVFWTVDDLPFPEIPGLWRRLA